jgi:hypothetical protein
VTPPPDRAQANGHRDGPATERTPPGQAKPKPSHEPRAHAKPHGGPAKVKPPRASTPKHVPAKSSKPKPSPKPVEPPPVEPAPPAKPEPSGQARGLQNEQPSAAEAATG